jgi:hypothetical protein
MKINNRLRTIYKEAPWANQIIAPFETDKWEKLNIKSKKYLTLFAQKVYVLNQRELPSEAGRPTASRRRLRRKGRFAPCRAWCHQMTNHYEILNKNLFSVIKNDNFY